MRVLIPLDKEFNKYKKKCRELFYKVQDKIGDFNKFETVYRNTFFYLFVDKNKIICAIYYYLKDDKLFVNAFAPRKVFDKSLECFKKSLSWFNCDIYAEARNRASAISLLRSGFVSDADKYIYKRRVYGKN